MCPNATSLQAELDGGATPNFAPPNANKVRFLKPPLLFSATWDLFGCEFEPE
jgi:hypothetical protein